MQLINVKGRGLIFFDTSKEVPDPKIGDMIPYEGHYYKIRGIERSDTRDSVGLLMERTTLVPMEEILNPSIEFLADQIEAREEALKKGLSTRGFEVKFKSEIARLKDMAKGVYDRIRILSHDLGFRPYNIGWYDNHLIELVGHPFESNGLIMIHARMTPDDPTTAQFVDTRKVLTAETVADILSGTENQDSANFVRAMGEALRVKL